MTNDLDQKRKRIEMLVKLAGLGIAGFLVAPFILATIQGIVGLAVALALGWGLVNFAPFFAMKNDLTFYGAIAVLIIGGFLITKGSQWCLFKLRYMKRVLWNGVGRCHKCNHPLSYTSKGRGICTNGDCKKV